MTVTLKGKLDTITAPAPEKKLSDGLDGIEKLIFDFTDLKCISSVWLRLFLYTDGILETTDSNEQMFGMDRLLAALNEKSDVPLKELLENVRNTVDGFVKEAEQFDDLTMLCLEYRSDTRNFEKIIS